MDWGDKEAIPDEEAARARGRPSRNHGYHQALGDASKSTSDFQQGCLLAPFGDRSRDLCVSSRCRSLPNALRPATGELGAGYALPGDRLPQAKRTPLTTRQPTGTTPEEGTP